MWNLEFALNGWTLAEFLKRVEAGALYWWWSDALKGSDGRQERGKLFKAVKHRLTCCGYLATGSLDPDDENLRVEIPHEHWMKMSGRFERSEAVLQCSGDKTNYYFVRVHPPLTGNRGARLLAGHSLIECFNEYVKGDQEFVQAATAASEDSGRSLHGLINSYCEGPFRNDGGQIWPVLERAGDRPVWIVNPSDHNSWHYLAEEPVAHQKWITANIIFQDRLYAVFSQLAIGNLIAEGFVAGRGREDVSRAMWQSGYKISVDFRSGDLVESEAEEGWTTLYRGLLLKLSEQVPAGRDELLATPVRKGVSAKDVELALARIFEGGWRPKAEVFELLKKKLPNISEREFSRHWANSAPDDWKRGGRRRGT